LGYRKLWLSKNGCDDKHPATVSIPLAFTRFRMPWRWDGQPVILQSRAWDDPATLSRCAPSSPPSAAKRKTVRTWRASPTSTQQPHELGHRRSKLIGENDVINAETLPKVRMPNKDNFIIKFPDRI
jgi:hypothetical protein